MLNDDPYLDQALMNEFFAEYEDAQLAIFAIIDPLIQSRGCSFDFEPMSEVFRRLHTIKGNYRMIGEYLQSDTVHYLETLLACFKSGTCDCILERLYLIKVIVEELRFLTLKKIQQQNVMTQLKQLADDIEIISSLPEVDLSKNILGFLQTVDLQGDYDIDFDLDTILTHTETPANASEDVQQIINNNDDLVFFKGLIEQLETFIPFWLHRSQKIMDLIVPMNRARDRLVDEEQLIAAIFMHDVGMGFIAPFITHKPYSLEPDEAIIMQDHIHLGSEFLKRIPGWDEAASIVAAHHENWNGSGYPLGLKAEQICHGARLLAIGDAYWAMTNDRMYVYKKKPDINALMDINKNSGVLYDEQWVAVFNEVLKKR
jgi:hypothetical protein